MSENKLTHLPLRNEETGETKVYELADEYARQQLGEKAKQTEVDVLRERISKKAEQSTLDDLAKTVTDTINADKTQGVKVEGTKLVIRV